MLVGLRDEVGDGGLNARAHEPRHDCRRQSARVGFLAWNERRDALSLRVRQNCPNQGGFSVESHFFSRSGIPFVMRVYSP
jgi:predicted membrane metal-binding protein